MTAAPATRFARGPDGYVAYQTVGEGPPDIILVNTWGNSIDLQWENALFERFNRRLASMGRLILFDKRSEGSSDPIWTPFEVLSRGRGGAIEEGARDMRTVLDHLGVPHAVVIGTLAGALMAISFAASFPDRAMRLVLTDPRVKMPMSEDYLFGLSEDELERAAAYTEAQWGNGLTLELDAPSLKEDGELRAWLARYERLALPKGLVRAHVAAHYDVRPLLPLVQAPTLVVAHTEVTRPIDPANPSIGVRGARGVGGSRLVAESVSNCVSYREVPTPDRALWAPQPPWVMDAIEEFVRGDGAPVRRAERIFAVVLFTDLVGSTQHLARAGDRRWSELLDVHDNVTGREVSRAGGKVVERTGDGLLATFDGPARAVACAESISAELGRLDLEVRAGVHAGEVELRGDKVGGIAVHIAARVMGAAGAGDVLVSRTIRDLVAGSGLEFEDRGMHDLKGLDESWQLFAVKR